MVSKGPMTFSSVSSGNPECLGLQFCIFVDVYFRSNSPRSAEQLGRLCCGGGQKSLRERAAVRHVQCVTCDIWMGSTPL